MGDHIRKRRLDLALTQAELATRLGVHETTLRNWELNATTPDWHYWSPIVRFLGYDPFPPARSLGERLVRHRRLLGLSQKGAASQLDVDPTTLAGWERNKRRPIKRLLARLLDFLGEPSGNSKA
ncbi:MAG: helix-turn-helix transcriptional regulator [Candidatus Zixiibacteriota bacterium]